MIFNPLVQIPSAVTESESEPSTSLGLGLYIAHEIVAMHGGTLVAESSEEDGTIFSTRLPRFPPARARLHLWWRDKLTRGDARLRK